MSRSYVMVILVVGLAPWCRAQEGGEQLDLSGPMAGAPSSVSADSPKLVLDTGGFTSKVTGLAFSPDGRSLAASGLDKTVRIWDLASGRLKATLRGYSGEGYYGACQSLAFSPDGRHLLVGVQDDAPEGTLRVYDLSDLNQIAELLPAHPEGGTMRLAFSGDGKYLASSGGPDNLLIIWDWPGRRPLHRIAVRGPLNHLDFPYRRLPVLWMTDIRGTVRRWSALDGKEGRWKNEREFLEICKDYGDATTLSGYYRDINAGFETLRKIKWPYSGKVIPYARDFEGGYMIAGGRGIKDSRDCYWAGMWNLAQDGRLVQLYEQHEYLVTAIALNANHTLAASGDILGNIHVWETRTGRRRDRFQGGGRPVYRVAFEAGGRQLAFGTDAYETGRWTYNNYAPLKKTFDLEGHRLIEGASGTYLKEVTSQGQSALTLTKDPKKQSNAILRYSRPGVPERTFGSGRFNIMCYTFLHSSYPGIDDPVVDGYDNGSLLCADPKTRMTRRTFLGHLGEVMSLSESPDGRFLASSSTDQTIRIWSLEHFRNIGDLDAGWKKNHFIGSVMAGGHAAKAGIKPGDRLVAIDGIEYDTLLHRFVNREWDFVAGQRVTVDLVRGDQPYQVVLELARGTDEVDPLLSLFTTAEGDWVLWTPEGYYDASLGGDRLIGWHVNQGRHQAAKFYLAQQFHKQFYRPDVIDRVLQAGDVSRAVAMANADSPRSEVALDIRRPEVLSRLEPPRVRILEPSDGTVTRTSPITVRAEVLSQNDLGVRDVAFLVNGRPGSLGKNIVRESGGSPTVVERSVALLPGQNEISVVASNEASTSQASKVQVRYETEQVNVTKPKLYLLAVGISKYAHSEFNLKYARADAEAFAASWKSQEGTVYSKVECRVLCDEQATVQSILDGMEWLVRSATQRDVTVLFLSSHGVRDERQNYYLATHEIDPDRLRSTGVRWNEVKSLIEDVPGKFLLFVDTCHSGAITGAKSLGGDPLRELVSEATGAVVFSSSMPREVSLEDGRWGHGAFTRGLLDVLADRAADLNGDGYLSLSELNDRVSERVKELTQGRQHTAVEWPPTISNFNFYRLDGSAR